jgi:hypothetical protein
MHTSRTVRHRFAVGSRAIGVDACSLVDVVRHRARPAMISTPAATQSAVAVIGSVRSSRKPAPGSWTSHRLCNRCRLRVAASFGQDRGKFGASVANSVAQFWVASVPNKRLVPTRQTNAPFSQGRARAAQPQR